ncbi:MAG: undecaprenyl/decaprenyl-phosphate alpha-N-acetylglucosaminyl 1-phosphate transferase [Chloroflexi bacterium]|nr:undecaprenyl/decaprenyl-phosphate alpha-N-acetylglucosaminyl 1-phosphate transferase [Chloroflexota bacterium]
MLFFFALVFFTALVVALWLTPVAIKLAARIGAMDQPAPRRVHDAPTARLGGIPIFGAFSAAVGVSLFFPRTDPNELPRVAGLFIGTTFMFAVGLYDDRRELKALPQLGAQLIAASIAVGAGIMIRELPNPFGAVIVLDDWFAVLFTLFWLMGMINTVNWLDGVDGLAAGVVILAAIVMFIHTFDLGQNSIALLMVALIGALAGFLPHNFFPAKIFLGTAGALVLGFTLGALSIIGGAKVASALLVLLIPILDVAWQIVSRVRAGKSPFQADRGHLHHRLLGLGLSQRAIVWVYYAFTALFGLLALILPTGAYKLLALVVISAGAAMVLVKVRSP